ERALVLDPDFALAHAVLSHIHGFMLWWNYDPSPARAAKQRAEAEAALRLAPQLPQAHQAMGLVYYWAHRDYQRALDEFRVAVHFMPNDAGLWSWVGFVERRLGHWAAVDSVYHRAVQLDPRNAGLRSSLGGETYLWTGRYADAVQVFDQALALAPDRYTSVLRGLTYLYWKGNLDTLRSVLAGMPADADLGHGASAVATRALLLLHERKADSLLVLLAGARGEGAEFDQM